MKKIALFTLVFARILNGMENPEYDMHKGLGGLSSEIQIKIVSHFCIFESLTSTIHAIKAISLVDKNFNDLIQYEYGNQERFQQLVYMLTEKFRFTFVCFLHSHHYILEKLNTEFTFACPWDADRFIACKLGTSAAKKYFQALEGSDASKKMVPVGSSTVLTTAKIKELMENNAQVNYFDLEGKTPLLYALKTGMSAKSIQLLLEYGADPTVKDNKNKGVFEYLNVGYSQKFELYRLLKPKIKKLLEDAIAAIKSD